MKRLCDVPGVVAIKDSAAEADFYRGEGALFLKPETPLKVLIDSDLAILDFLRMGVHGATSICAALNPNAYLQLFRQRHVDRAAKLQEALLPLAQAVYATPFRDFRARLKTVLVADGSFATLKVRAPLMPLSRQERSGILDASAKARKGLSRLLQLAD